MGADRSPKVPHPPVRVIPSLPRDLTITNQRKIALSPQNRGHNSLSLEGKGAKAEKKPYYGFYSTFAPSLSEGGSFVRTLWKKTIHCARLRELREAPLQITSLPPRNSALSPHNCGYICLPFLGGIFGVKGLFLKKSLAGLGAEPRKSQTARWMRCSFRRKRPKVRTLWVNPILYARLREAGCLPYK